MSLQSARGLAAAHPQAMLPCPVCGTGVRGSNLERHLGKSHAGAPSGDAAAAWSDQRGLSAARLSADGDELALRGRTGLRTRRLALPAAVEVGGLERSRMTSVGSSYVDDYPGMADATTERAGVYLRLGSATIGCRSSTDVRKHWTGWKQAGRRRRCDIMLAPADFVALQYLLAARGLLALRAA